MFREVVKYLRKHSTLKNIFFAYSPVLITDDKNLSKETYLSYYPGDKYVDIMGVDAYTDDPIILANNLKIMCEYANSKNKKIAITEIGHPGKNLRSLKTEEVDKYFRNINKVIKESPCSIEYLTFWKNSITDNFVPSDKINAEGFNELLRSCHLNPCQSNNPKVPSSTERK